MPCYFTVYVYECLIERERKKREEREDNINNTFVYNCGRNKNLFLKNFVDRLDSWLLFLPNH